MSARQAWAEAWPEGVVTRYATVGGATVDLRAVGDRVQGDCTGCEYHIYSTVDYLAKERAQGHAEKCRALPKPGGAR